MLAKKRSIIKTDLLNVLKRLGKDDGCPIDGDTKRYLENICKQNLESVRLYFKCDKILDELGAKGACWQNKVFLHSLYTNTETLLHEIAHAAQWLKFGNCENVLNNTVSVEEDSCEEEARRFATLNGRENRHFPLTHPCSASVMLDPVSEHLLVDCQIVGHASPRWKTAKTDQQRVENNQILSMNRANAVQKFFESQLKNNLPKFSLEFRYNQTLVNDDAVPSGTVVIGTQSRGQQDSIIASHGDKKSVDPNYQRVDLLIRIARKNKEIYPTQVKEQYKIFTKTKSWYVSVGLSVGFYAGAGCSYLIVKLRNLWDQEAIGSAYACGGGVGAALIPGNTNISKLGASVSFGDEGIFMTNKDVDFEDFNFIRILYTSATFSIGGGYNLSYISFPTLGVYSVPVGGLTLGEFSAAGNLNLGLLWLHSVPINYIIKYHDMTEWNENTSEWITEHNLRIYFTLNSTDITPVMGELNQFAREVATDILQK